jgi:hypothetical protein
MHKVGNRTDFQFFTHCDGMLNLTGVTKAVHKTPAVGPLPQRYNYTIESNGTRYFVSEDNVSTPYGKDDL